MGAKQLKFANPASGCATDGCSDGVCPFPDGVSTQSHTPPPAVATIMFPAPHMTPQRTSTHDETRRHECWPQSLAPRTEPPHVHPTTKAHRRRVSVPTPIADADTTSTGHRERKLTSNTLMNDWS
jgi:hypothetical protein